VFVEVLDTISKEVTSHIASLFVAQMQCHTRGVQYRLPVKYSVRIAKRDEGRETEHKGNIYIESRAVWPGRATVTSLAEDRRRCK
jgi:hypothetical protein